MDINIRLTLSETDQALRTNQGDYYMDSKGTARNFDGTIHVFRNVKNQSGKKVT